MSERKYAIHEGFITSKNDGDRHFISFTKLCNLYQIKTSEAVNWARDGRGRKFDDYIHLYPSYEGNYLEIKARTERE